MERSISAIGRIIVAMLVKWEGGVRMEVLVLIWVLLLMLMMLGLLGGKGTFCRFAVACGARLSASALLLLSLTQITSARDTLSLLGRPHVAGRREVKTNGRPTRRLDFYMMSLRGERDAAA